MKASLDVLEEKQKKLDVLEAKPDVLELHRSLGSFLVHVPFRRYSIFWEACSVPWYRVSFAMAEKVQVQEEQAKVHRELHRSLGSFLLP